jgi:hypothetical protein
LNLFGLQLPNPGSACTINLSPRVQKSLRNRKAELAG